MLNSHFLGSGLISSCFSTKESTLLSSMNLDSLSMDDRLVLEEIKYGLVACINIQTKHFTDTLDLLFKKVKLFIYRKFDSMLLISNIYLCAQVS